MKILITILTAAAVTAQAALAEPHDRQMSEPRAPQRQVQRFEAAPVMRERAMPARPQFRERAMPARPQFRERAMPAQPQFRERAMPVRPQFHERVMPHGWNGVSAPAAVWRDQHARFVQIAPRAAVVFERFHPRHVMLVDPVVLAPQIVTPEIVTSQFVMPVVNAAPVSYVYTGYAPAFVPTIGYAATFAAVPITPFAAFSGDCDEDDGCYGPSAVSYVQPAYTYVGPAVNPFGNAQLQGVVIGQTGNNLIVLAPNLQPVFVNTGVAAQAGYLQGSVAPGTVIDALGYYTGNEFIATSLV